MKTWIFPMCLMSQIFGGSHVLICNKMGQLCNFLTLIGGMYILHNIKIAVQLESYGGTLVIFYLALFIK